MTLREWSESDQGRVHIQRWAADTKGGFGRKGDIAYGDCRNCEVIRFEYDDKGYPTLYLWDFNWGVCPEPNDSTKDKMLRMLQEMLTNYHAEVARFGREDRVVAKKFSEMIGCKEMAEAIIGLPVNLGKDGLVTVGY